VGSARARAGALIMQDKQTKSEALFLQYCALRGYVANRIPPPVDRGQFPDYE
jgi:hypothetical protein